MEAYSSWLDYGDRVFVLDGESQDDTADALAALAEVDPRFEWTSRPWPDTRVAGASIADFTNEALRLARQGAERLMYVQADEIYTVAQRRTVHELTDGALEFAGCINFWNSMDTVVANDFPMTYLRLFQAREGVRSIGDGFSFAVDGQSVRRTDELILHYGWCFPVNILKKHVTHANLYPDQLPYRVRGRLAAAMLEEGNYDRRLLDALAPAYRPTPFHGEHPECVRHLLGRDAYDPELGLSLLRSGVSW